MASIQRAFQRIEGRSNFPTWETAMVDTVLIQQSIRKVDDLHHAHWKSTH